MTISACNSGVALLLFRLLPIEVGTRMDDEDGLEIVFEVPASGITHT
ncbi:hypothetical protein [Streptomyces sp. A5-4]